MSANDYKVLQDTFQGVLGLQLQKKRSTLEDTVMREMISSERDNFDLAGKLDMKQIVARNSESEETPLDWRRVWVSTSPAAANVYFDQYDKARVAVGDPTSRIYQACTAAYARKKDQVILKAFDAAISIGRYGTETENFDASKHQIAHGSADVTLQKILKAREILFTEFNEPNDEYYMVAHPAVQTAMLQWAETTSQEFAAVKALVSGEIDKFAGFTWIWLPEIAAVSTVRPMFAYVKSGMILAENDNYIDRVVEAPTKNFTIQVHMQRSCGATRTEPGKVIKILNQES